MATMTEQFIAARRASTPVVAINTPDQKATIDQIRDALKPTVEVLAWDMLAGLVELQPAEPVDYGTEGPPGALARIVEGASQDVLRGPYGAVELLSSGMLPASRSIGRVVVILQNAHRWIDDAAVTQAIANVRDECKAEGIMIVLLSPGITLPVELQPDVLILEEELPDREQLATIVDDIATAAGVELQVNDGILCVDALQGLAAFPAEQALAMSVSREGIDLDGLWDRKRQMIAATPGLKVYRGAEEFGDVAGVANIKSFLEAVITKGQRRPKAIVFVDEIEKSMAGSSSPVGDTSGVSQDYHGQLLQYMENTEATGMIFVGPPGCTKSMVAKTAGSLAGIPTIELDLGGMKGAGGGIIGTAENAIRAALKVISAVSGEQALFIATSNSIKSLSPELRRRFKLGIFYFDLPTDEERAAIWRVWLRKYDLGPRVVERGVPMPDDPDWTGAEIKQCCELSWNLGITLEEASRYIVPVARSAREAIVELREDAEGRYISASSPGVYEKPKAKARTVRQLRDVAG